MGNLYPEQVDLNLLVTPITLEEIEATITNLPNGKSSGPDGYTVEFYKKLVKIMLPDLTFIFAAITDRGIPLLPLNTSYITLIPKTEAPTRPEDFRPISLIHGVQKIFSKNHG